MNAIETIEQAIEALEVYGKHTLCNNLRALLERMKQQEPVAIVKLIEHLPDEYELLAVFNKPLLVGDGDKLYTTPQLPQGEGWQTIEAAFREGFRSPATYNDVLVNDEDNAWRAYKKTLAAAPKPTEGK